jgi:serine/threonine protein kinase
MAIRPTSTRQAGQIQREIKAMTIIKNPYVLGLKHVDMECHYPKSDGTKKHCILLAIELAGGGELFDYMMYTGAFSEPICKVYTRQLLEALIACHQQGVYHRDLKPENLLLDDNFTLKVADFGYSAIQNSHDGERLLHTECGTRSYMAPEVLSHQPYDGTSVDIWSAAVVIFIMLTGNPPMQLATRSDWWYNCLANGNTERFWKAHMRACPNLSVGARSFLNKMLKPNAADRASIAELLSDPWLASDGEESEVSGRPCDAQTLRFEMENRKKQVEAAKQKEKEKVKLAAAQAKIAADARGTFDPFQQQQQVRRCASASKSYRIQSAKSTAEKELTASNDNTKIYLPSVFYGSSGESETKNALSAMEQLLKSLEGNLAVEVNSNKDKIKCSSNVNGVATSFVVKLEVDDDDDLIVAKISKRGGDTFAFRKLFEALNSKINGGSEEVDQEIVDGVEPIDMM